MSSFLFVHFLLCDIIICILVINQLLPSLRLHPSSSTFPLLFVQCMQGEKDWEKYEVARKLKLCVDDIRNQYLRDLKSKEMSTRQRAVALYFIDKVGKERCSN